MKLPAEIKYKTLKGYREEKYWSDRLKKYKFNIQGVGNKSLTKKQNIIQYSEAARIFKEKLEEIYFSQQMEVLDIGCGNGFYAEILRGCKYTGIDITDQLMPKLRERFPEGTFLKADITKTTLPGKYDLIVMIDVTQHITNDKKFSRAMSNIKTSLKKDGYIIMTSWLKEKDFVNSFYEVKRSFETISREFPGWQFSASRKFRDKYIFHIKR